MKIEWIILGAFVAAALLIVAVRAFVPPPADEAKADYQLNRVLTAIFGRWQRWLP